MMMRIVSIGLVTLILSMNVSVAADFESVKAKNFAGDKMVFPAVVQAADSQGADIHLLFLGIAADQDNGTYQGKELVKWHKALIAAGVDTEVTAFWHFPVIENPPFFVKGLIRRGIAKDYADILPPERGAVLFVDDIKQFAEFANLPVDGQPTVAIYSEQNGIIALHRGEATDTGVEELAAALKELLPANK